MLTLRGTPFLYNGEEIGMSDYYLNDINLFRDPPAVWFYNGRLEDGMPAEEALELAAFYSRDRCRTPMQWSNNVNAGFSPEGIRTWLPVNPNYAQGVNVDDQRYNPDSLFSFYKGLLRVRKQSPALKDGDYTPLHETAMDYFAFLRKSQDGEQTCLVVLNLSDKNLQLKFDLPSGEARPLFSSSALREESVSLEELKITPFEIFIGELTS